MSQQQTEHPALEMSGQASTSTPPAALLAVVEDNDDIREAFVEALEEAGYCVVGFDRARAALEALDSGLRPDLILLDLMMPEMDGWTFRLEQKKRPLVRDIPVVAVSADVSPQAAAIDADAYLRKPVDFARLTLVVEQVLAASVRKQLMLKGVELERLRSLGMLVASIAHEVNNPLAAVTGYLDLCSRYAQRGHENGQIDPGLAHKLGESIDAARDGTQRIASIVKLLLTFARSDDQSGPIEADPARALEAAVSLAMPQVRHKAQIVRIGGSLPKVAVNEARLAQVFLNLLLNAAHAIAKGTSDDNRIEICLSHDARNAIIEVSDTGSGIAPEIIDKIFEPFFSTRSADEGTGLGLSISRHIVHGAGGSIQVRSELGCGSTFRVELPLLGTLETSRPSKPKRASSPTEGRYRILVVDDEPLVGRMLRAMLDEHEVHEYTDPERAVADLAVQDFDLVLCDWLMPRMTGEDVYRHIQRIKPALAPRFVLMTGAAPSDALERFMGELSQPVLRKPFTAQALYQSLSRLTGTQGTSAPLLTASGD